MPYSYGAVQTFLTIRAQTFFLFHAQLAQIYFASPSLNQNLSLENTHGIWFRSSCISEMRLPSPTEFLKQERIYPLKICFKKRTEKRLFGNAPPCDFPVFLSPCQPAPPQHALKVCSVNFYVLGTLDLFFYTSNTSYHFIRILSLDCLYYFTAFFLIPRYSSMYNISEQLFTSVDILRCSYHCSRPINDNVLCIPLACLLDDWSLSFLYDC